MKAQSAMRSIPVLILVGGIFWSLCNLNAATVMWYRFEEGGTNYIPATNIVDSGPNGLHGVAFPPGVLRYAPANQTYPVGGSSALASFGSGVARLPSPGGTALHRAFTIELLFRPFEDVPDPAEWNAILSKRASEDPQSEVTLKVEYRLLGREVRLSHRVQGGGFGTIGGEGTLVRSPNGWHHLVMTFSHHDDGQFHSFKSAIILDGSAAVYQSGTGDVYADLGAGEMQIGGGFYGLVDEVRLSDEVLEDSDRLVHFPRGELVATVVPKVEITFPTSRNSFYSVEWTQDVCAGNWQSLEPFGQQGTGFPMTVVDQEGFGQRRFYRVYEYE